MDMVNTSGLTEARIKGTSSMESGMVMVFGRIKTKQKYTQGAIGWTRSKGLVCINGLANRFTKVNFVKTLGKDSEGCIK